MRAVRFDAFGGVEALEVREGVFAERWPTTSPSGQGATYAGNVGGSARE